MIQLYSKKELIFSTVSEYLCRTKCMAVKYFKPKKSSIKNLQLWRNSFLSENLFYQIKYFGGTEFNILKILQKPQMASRIRYLVVLVAIQSISGIEVNATPDVVSTSVKLSGSASYGYEEHHPLKWGCLGKNSKSAFDYDKGEEVTYQTNQGSAAISNTIDEGHTIQNKIENQSVDWNFNFDKEDYSFHLKFKKNVGNGIEFHNRRHCNTRSWHYKIDSATSKVNSSVSIVVPSNVWIVEIENLTVRNVGHDPKFKIKNVYSKRNGGLELGDETIYRPIHYFYVSPGDEITLELEFDDTGSNIDLISELKVTFFGYNRCDQIIKASLGDDQESFSSDRILSALKSGLNSNNQNGVLPQRRQTMLFLGCLTARPTIQKLLFNNDINDLKSILASIESINREVIFNWKNNSIRAYDHILADISYIRKLLFNSDINDLKSSLAGIEIINSKVTSNWKDYYIRAYDHILADIGYMARFSISQSILDSTHSLCKEYPFMLDNGELGFISAYMRTRHRLDKMLEILKLNESGIPQSAAYLKTTYERLRKIAGDSGIQDGSEIVNQINELGQSYKQKGILTQIKRLSYEAGRIPTIEHTKSYEDFRNALDEFYSLVKDFNLHLHRHIKWFDKSKAAQINFSEIDQITSQIEPAGKKFGFTLRRFLSQFEGQYAKNYLNGLSEIESRHYVGTMEIIEGSYNGHFKGFFSLYHALNLDKLSKCLENPTRSGK